MNTRAIRYCHWKSNEHVKAAMAGETDLDLLISEDDADAFSDLLGIYNFKQIVSPPEKTYPGIEDYLGFDSETGKCAHLNVHYRLITGKKFIKNHQLPYELLFL